MAEFVTVLVAATACSGPARIGRQSGRSPDLVAATEAARAGGALTLALVNDPDSPAARASDLVLPILPPRARRPKPAG
jgi:D-arabinose 5-phosphate isomerase GutQ